MGCGPSKNTVANTRSSDEKISGAEMMFLKYDKDNSGFISKSEFKELCLYMGYRLTDQELDVDMKTIGGKDERISKTEFVKWWKTEKKFSKLQWTPAQLEMIQKIQESFKQFDKDNSGHIDKAESKKLHQLLTESKLTNKPFEEAMKDLDGNNDGKIDYTEYVQYLLNQMS